jgi:tetratricopeptide (TPR) repeat protein
MDWFSKKSDVPNADEFRRMFDEGIGAFHAGQFQRSIDLLLEALNKIDCKPTNFSAQAWGYVGLAELQLHDRDKNTERLINAEGALLCARAFDHNNPPIIYNLGSCYFQQRRYQEAEKCFLDYVHIKPDPNALLKLGAICYETNRHQEAIHYWKQVLSIEPNNSGARENLKHVRGY